MSQKQTLTQQFMSEHRCPTMSNVIPVVIIVTMVGSRVYILISNSLVHRINSCTHKSIFHSYRKHNHKYFCFIILSPISTSACISWSSNDVSGRQVGHRSLIAMVSQEHFQTCTIQRCKSKREKEQTQNTVLCSNTLLPDMSYLAGPIHLFLSLSVSMSP